MSVDSIPCDIYVDISNADCHLPFSRLSDALEVLQVGQTLLAVLNRQALLTDIPTYCQQRKVRLVEHGEVDAMFYFVIRLQDC